ncbi:MAG: anaerobic ribonucleoside-triphosphate reductase activating protein [Deltaproteobacteria bacterium]|jgi:anaerobic ribonucleoside-triphosphate reductase activating protein|nr:anaerobic ribonucleoside-triphosphate reductase activating protein [Deltaproteobacteria bacterium]
MNKKVLRVSGVVEESIVDGPGLRFVIFTQGCPHRCPGCHNPETHDPDGGSLADCAALITRFRENPLLAGITFSGGEPFLQAAPLCEIAEQVKADGKTVMVYTGYLYEQLQEQARSDADLARLLDLADVLVDGPYLEELRAPDLLFRGSSNQRVINKNTL